MAHLTATATGYPEPGFFEELWGTFRGVKVAHSPEVWDERAEEWIAEIAEDSSRLMARVHDNTGFLKSCGALTDETSVVDVGCGPGLFSLECAKTAKFSVGLDFSPRFVGYGNDCAGKQGLPNAVFECCDFAEEDTSRYDGRFTLAFSSITPAVSTCERLAKFVRLSTAWCANVAFVNFKDDLAAQISRDVFEEEYQSRWDGTGFYSLLNLLWLDGYYPLTHYYDDVRHEKLEPAEANARYMAESCRHFEPEGRAKVLRWLETKGGAMRHSVAKFGMILWDRRERDPR
ncbi:MAG: class I SAM-dependent methyltransferase [Lachnospiraceae bacterium]|jgi:SAM-dependent methyltransferase|nr:class I SAM-dependent methyltransferase [Lachnospiraceae bacterium]